MAVALERSWTSVHLSVVGDSHIKKGTPCQDASVASLLDEDGLWCYAIVADGHGGARHFRSGEGAQIAVDCMREAFEHAYGRIQDGKAKGLANLAIQWPDLVAQWVLLRWQGKISEHLIANPPTPDEPGVARYLGEVLSSKGERAVGVLHEDLARLEELIERTNSSDPVEIEWLRESDPVAEWYVAYGTTLLGVMVGPDAMYWFQLGDGGIGVVRESSANFLLQPNSKMVGNETASLCMPNVLRHVELGGRYFASSEDVPDAFVVTTDGLPNSYVEREGFYEFCSDITKPELSNRDLKANLPVWLAEISRRGSGDDMSVAVLRANTTETPPVAPPITVEKRQWVGWRRALTRDAARFDWPGGRRSRLPRSDAGPLPARHHQTPGG